MASEIELETLLVRIKGDATMYREALNRSISATKEFASSVRSALGNVFQSFAALGAMHYLKEWLGEWKESEKATKQLAAIVGLNGRAVQETMEDYSNFADQIQKITKYSDEATLGMLRQAEAFGLTGKAARAAVQNAIALGALKDQDAAGFLRMTIAAQQGNVALLLSSRGIGAFVKDAKTETEKLVKVQEMLRKGFELAQVGGGMAKLRNAISDFKEDLGKVVAEYVNPLVVGLRVAAQWAKTLSDETKRGVVAFMAMTAFVVGFGPFVAILKATLIPTLVAFGVVAAYQLGYVGKLFDWLGKVFNVTTESMKDTWKGFSDVFKSGDLTLGWEIAMAQIKISFATALMSMGTLWIEWTSSFDRGVNLLAYRFQDTMTKIGGSFARGLNLLFYKVGLATFDQAQAVNEQINRGQDKMLKELFDARKEENDKINEKQLADLSKWDEESKAVLAELLQKKKTLLGLAAAGAAKAIPPPGFEPPLFPESLKKGAGAGADAKIEAAAFGSAEALTRIESQRDSRQDKTNGYLKDIRDILKDQEHGADLELAPAGVG